MNIKTAKKEIVNRLLLSRSAGRPFIVAVDGRCASGKTTFANELSAASGAAVVHMDDFFLQPFQRTEQRLAAPGENVDWERFKAELILPLTSGKTASFRPFDCHTLGFKDEVSVSPENGVIVEGTYCLNKELCKNYSLSVFLTVSPEIQMKRIIARNGKDGAQVFAEKWIPLEEKYFSAYRLQEKCDYVINTD